MNRLFLAISQLAGVIENVEGMGKNGAVCFASTSSQLAIIHVHLLHTKILYLLLSGFCLLGLIYVLGGRLMISSRCSIKFFALFASISAIRSCQKKAYANEKHEDKSPTQIGSKLIMTALKWDKMFLKNYW